MPSLLLRSLPSRRPAPLPHPGPVTRPGPSTHSRAGARNPAFVLPLLVALFFGAHALELLVPAPICPLPSAWAQDGGGSTGDGTEGEGDDGAGTDEAGGTEGEPAEPPVEVPDALRTPRATMTNFLEAFDVAKTESGDVDLEQAVQCLDLSGLDASLRKQVGKDMAVQLKEALDRTELIDFAAIPDSAEGEPWSLRVGERKNGEDLHVVLAPDEHGRWLFTSETLDRLPEMLSSAREREVVEGVTAVAPLTFAQWVRERMPESLLGMTFLLEGWQWVALLLLILVGLVLDRVVTSTVQLAIERYLARRMEQIDPEELREALRPTGLLTASLVWWLGILWLGLPTQVLTILAIAVKFVACTSFVWASYRLVDIVSAIFAVRANRTDNKFDDLLVPLVRKSGKLMVAALGFVFIADNLDVDITSLVAGLGIGGLALALAAQDAVRNVFGSLLVILDQPFSVGDWVKIGDVEGTVVELGFRSTRIRTFYDSLITLPNANLIDASVDNLGARSYRRWTTHLGLEYGTPAEKVEAFCEGLRELIRQHPYTRKDSFHVYLNRFSGSSIDVLLYMFFDTPDWGTELRERHRLALDIMRLAQSLGVGFAFPTQTLYLNRPGDPDPLAPIDTYGSDLAGVHEEARQKARALVEGSLGGKMPPPVGAAPGSEADG